MNIPKVYGTFFKRRGKIYRKSTYIQWGNSEKSIGACLLLNPGSATLDKNLKSILDTAGLASGLIKTEDPTMEQLILFVNRIYGEDKPVSGRLHIYNLFNLQNTKSVNAIDEFEELILSGEYDINDSLVEINEIKSHPWILIGWGVKQEKRWGNLQSIKEKWMELLEKSKVPVFGKKHLKQNDYYHPCPRIPTQRPLIIEELVEIYKQKFCVQRFPQYATKPNLIIESGPVEMYDIEARYRNGWHKSSNNPESIVKSFSHLGMKEGYKLRAYQYTSGGNGNGVVWALPKDKELPDPSECEYLDSFLSSPRPTFALPDFMEAIEGDRTPLSYLQASIVFHKLHEFGAMWHGVSWGRDVILPVKEDMVILSNQYEWVFEDGESEPEIVHPHFYYNEEGNAVVVFYTVNDIGTVTLNRYEHIFNKDNYILSDKRTIIATAGGGIIF